MIAYALMLAQSREVLLPDPYALGSNGYAEVRNQFLKRPLPPWKERLPLAFWRGSSTEYRLLR